MIQKFESILQQNHWHGKVVIAVSGGADSMVLAALFHQANRDIVLAHFNYGLRKEDSEKDQELVAEWALSNNIPFYFKKFDLGDFLKREGGNLQETARELRYEWLEQIRKELNFDLIATAHHQGDSIETLLINFFKGTGITGLHGILPQKGKVIRPLLSFKKSEVVDFAEVHNVPWRLDKSNEGNDYLRNKIRNQLLPLITEALPSVEDNLQANIKRFSETEILYKESIERYRKKLIEFRGKDRYISILKLRKSPALFSITYELLKPFGFSSGQIQDVLSLLDSESGKMVQSLEYKIIRDRGFLIITPVNTIESTFILIHRNGKKQKIQLPDFKFELEFTEQSNFIDWDQIETATRQEAYLDLKKIEFPLILRKRKEGDYFYPLGMSGKKKKISHFLRNQKVPLHEKDNIWVLESNKRILWVVGFRIDDRFKMTSECSEFLHLKLK